MPTPLIAKATRFSGPFAHQGNMPCLPAPPRGASLTGAPPLTATLTVHEAVLLGHVEGAGLPLTVTGAVADDWLGYAGSGQGILCADVTGDGTLDIVAKAYLANIGGVTDTGAVYVWEGGAGLTGDL